MIARRISWSLACLGWGLVCLSGCGGGSTPEKPEKKAEAPAEPVTGRTALYRMYSMARGQWSKDALVVRLTSMRVSGLPETAPGLAYAWEAVFAANGGAKSYTYSEVEQLPELHKGAFAGPAESLSGKPFYIEGAKIDSDEAYKKAVTKDAKEAAKYKDKPVTLLLEMNAKYGEPVWRVVWGDSLSTAPFSAFVGASTGMYLDTVH